MLLRVFCWQSGGYWLGMTRYCGHEKKWIGYDLKELKQKTGPFLGRAHRQKAMLEVTGLTFVEGIPDDDTVYLISEPPKRPYIKRVNKTSRKTRKKYERLSAKGVVVDGIVYRSLQEAEKKCGFKKDTLGQALRHGQKESMGHTISYYHDVVETPKYDAPKQPTQPKVETDNTEYLYKVESGYLKIYRKELCQSYKVCVF